MRDAQALAFVGLIVVAALTGELDASGYLVWGATAGAVGAVALGCFYTALSQGTMGVVAPIAATGVVVPVTVGIIRGDSPSVLQVVGIAVTIIGVVLAAGPERAPEGHTISRERKPLLLAGVAAVGFGTALVLVAEGGEHSVVMTIATMRLVNPLVATLALTLFVRDVQHPRRSDLPMLLVIGATDAGANGMYALATTMSLISVTAVFASLYPAVTALLAWRFHHEHLRREQVAGVALILAGVACLAAG
jgi:drug/metabolite transporter (DMT)-like permease